MNRGHPGHADTNLQVKAKRAALLGQFSEAVKARPVSRPLTPPLHGLGAALLGQLSEAVKAGPVSRPLTPPQTQG